jgi:hypothetical protein
MIIKRSNSKLKLFLTAMFLFLAIPVISTGCMCPLFTLVERLTGFEIKTGKDIDESRVVEELIYPGSMVLVQFDGDINRIKELISRYGVNLYEEELSALNELPQEVKEQEVNATIYSTADDKMEVLDYYDSLDNKGWGIRELQDGGKAESKGKPTALIASSDEKQQAFMLVGTRNNTFIIFIDFDWEALSEMEK